MFAKLCSRLTFANVVASIALFIALGGTSYAVATGSIDSREIKDDTVRSKDVRNETLLRKDFKPGHLPAGPRGETGPPGPPGATGAPGSARAYAKLVMDSGVLTVSATKGVTASNFSVSAASGTVCIRGLSFTPSSVATAAEFRGPPLTDVTAEIPPLGGACSEIAGAQAGIRFMQSSNGAQLNSGAGFVLIN